MLQKSRHARVAAAADGIFGNALRGGKGAHVNRRSLIIGPAENRDAGHLRGVANRDQRFHVRSESRHRVRLFHIYHQLYNADSTRNGGVFIINGVPKALMRSGRSSSLMRTAVAAGACTIIFAPVSVISTDRSRIPAKHS